MSKTHEYRKLALIVAFVLGTGLSLAACGTQSSTDDAASHPGDNYIGSIVVTVDPKGPSLDIQQVNPVLSNTNITGDATFSVSTVGTPTYASNTLTGNVKFKWKGTQKLEDVRIGVYSTSGTGLNANAMDPEAPTSLANRDNCTAYPDFGTAIAAGCRPGYTYVADTKADGPETEIEVLSEGSVSRKSRYLRVICPDCGSVTSKWMLQDTSGTTAYTFSAYVFGTKHARDIMNDSRFDNDTATIKAFAYRPNSTMASLPTVNQSAPLSTVKTGQWFYVSVWYDSPGLVSRNNTTWPPCRDGGNAGNPAGCDITQTKMDNDDFYFVEDKANMDVFAAWKAGGSNYLSNTGFAYTSWGTWFLRWDPAVLQTNDTTTTKIGSGSGANAFKTRVTAGTTMATTSDDVTTDQFSYDSTFSSGSNTLNRASCAVHLTYSIPTTIPIVGDGLNTYAGYQQGDMNVCKLSLKAIGASGTGSRIDFAPAAGTVFGTAVGYASAAPATANDIVAQKSPNYPIWADASGLSQGPGGAVGHYNEQYAWVCIQ